MPRVRLAAVLLVPPPVSDEVDGLRRACDDPALGRVAAHVTIVPPVNVRVELLPDVLRVLRVAAGEIRPSVLRIGPPRSFLPVSPTLYLEVGDDPERPGGLEAVHRLQRRVRSGPLERPLEHEFVPHVTLAQQAEAARIEAAIAVLGSYTATVEFDRLHLMQEQKGADGVRRWAPVADVPFGPVRVVGRGGLALELTASQLVDPEAQAVVLGSPEERSDGRVPDGAVPLVVTARHEGRAVGVVTGWTRDDGATETSLVAVADGVWPRDDLVAHLRAVFVAAAADRRDAGDPAAGWVDQQGGR